MKKLRFIPIFLIAVSLYILYRSNEVRINTSILNNGNNISAVVKNKNQENSTISYLYNFKELNYTKTETTDRNTFINNIIGDKISVYVDPQDPKKSIIVGNKYPISLINFNIGSISKIYTISYWYGILIGIVLLSYGILRLYKEIKKTPRTL